MPSIASRAAVPADCLRTTLCHDLVLPYWHEPAVEPRGDVLVWLHGAGEKGSHATERANDAIVAIARRHAPWFDVVCPVCPAGVSGWSVAAVLALVDHLEMGRVVLAGTSMGGRGVYDVAYDHADRFAGLVVIAAFGVPTLMPRLRRTPLWIAHGANDEVVPVQRARDLAAAHGAAIYRELPAGHACVAQALDDPDLWSWLERALSPSLCPSEPG